MTDTIRACRPNHLSAGRVSPTGPQQVVLPESPVLCKEVEIHFTEASLNTATREIAVCVCSESKIIQVYKHDDLFMRHLEAF